MKQLLFAASATLFLVSAALAQNAPPMSFACGLKPGDTVRYGFQEVEITTNKAGVIRSGVNHHQFQLEAQMAFRVTEATPQGLTVELKYERIRFQAESPVLKEPPVIDTGSPADELRENPLAPAMLGIINKPIILRLDSHGAIRSLDDPGINLPDVKFAGVAGQMLTAAWITPRFQPVFSLTAPETSAPVASWTITRQTPIAQGNTQTLKIAAFHVLQPMVGGLAPVQIAAKAELQPFSGEGVNMNVTLTKFNAGGNALWDPAAGILQSRSEKCEWSLDARPEPDLQTSTDVSIQTVLARLKP